MVFHLPELSTPERQYYLQHLVAPRPIGLVATVNRQGAVNLSPFSFFNLFSSDPPVVIFSACRRVRDNTRKHTLENIEEVPQAVIHLVNYSMVEQVSLASCDYPKGTDEFIKAGFTKEKACYVQPPMVREAPAKLECKVIELKPLGKNGGAGNLVICEALALHIHDDLLVGHKLIHPAQLDLVARLGDNWYTRISQSNLFEAEKPHSRTGIGFDGLPGFIRESRFLTGSEIARLAGVPQLPGIDADFDYPDPAMGEEAIFRTAALLIHTNKIDQAWQLLLHYKQSTL
ncbi:MAG: flavin reductase family protein [Chitinophagaceae bacterium]